MQHALALERGFPNWPSLTASAARPTHQTREIALTALLEAAVDGDGARLRAVLDEYPDIINERGLLKGHSGMRTALHHAVETNEDAVRLLLERGADPKSATKETGPIRCISPLRRGAFPSCSF